jgi:gentisate 1,2-dioxygenase
MGPGDVFVTPSWAAVDHESDDIADLFVVTDAPVLKALHLYRAQQLPDAQQITGFFSRGGPSTEVLRDEV